MPNNTAASLGSFLQSADVQFATPPHGDGRDGWVRSDVTTPLSASKIRGGVVCRLKAAKFHSSGE